MFSFFCILYSCFVLINRQWSMSNRSVIFEFLVLLVLQITRSCCHLSFSHVLCIQAIDWWTNQLLTRIPYRKNSVVWHRSPHKLTALTRMRLLRGRFTKWAIIGDNHLIAYLRLWTDCSLAVDQMLLLLSKSVPPDGRQRQHCCLWE